MELWEANTYVTGSNPGWPGQNVYIANSGSTQAIPVAISGSAGASQATGIQTGSFAYHSSSSRLIMSASTGRVGFKIYNDTETNYIIAFGLTASLSTITVVIPPQWIYDDGPTMWQGPVAGIGVGLGSGTIYWTELIP